jgi:hypothetical protein
MVTLQAPKIMTLEQCLEYIAQDELVEITLATGTEFKINSKSYIFSDEIYNKENALRKLRAFIDAVEKLSEQFKSKVALNNLMSDTVQKLEKEYGLILKFN